MKIPNDITYTIRTLLESSIPQDQPDQVNQVNQEDPMQQSQPIDPNNLSTQEIATIEGEIRGIEDPVKTFIDRVIDLKNNVLQQESNREIGNLINKA